MEVTKNPVSSGKLSDPAVRLSPLHSQQEKTGLSGGAGGGSRAHVLLNHLL